MDDQRHDSPSGDSGAVVDPGPPVAELAGLRESPGDGFVGRLLRRLQRRETAGQAVEFSLAALAGTWWSYLTILCEWLGEHRSRETKERDDD